MLSQRGLSIMPGTRRKIADLLLLCSMSMLLSACSIFGGGSAATSQAVSGTNLTALPTAGDFERGAPLRVGQSHKATYNGARVDGRVVLRQDNGLVLPDGGEGVLLIPGRVPPAQDPNYIDARELKLKMRELAAQLVANLDKSLAGYVALPTAFVSQDDFQRSSSLGRFIVEQMYYEFNQRGLPTREYRLDGRLMVREDGEFILARQNGSSPLDSRAIYLVGTYYSDQSTVFINARLIRADGRVLRTGQLIMPVNPLTSRMLATSGRSFREGSLEILDFDLEARPPAAATAFDQGMDIH